MIQAFNRPDWLNGKTAAAVGLGVTALFVFWGFNNVNRANAWVELPPHYLTLAINEGTLSEQPALKPIVEEALDTRLQARLEQVIAQYPSYLKPHLYYTHLRSGRYVNLNADEPVPAASVIKLPILFAWCKALDEQQATPMDHWLYDTIHQAGGSGTLQYKQPGFTLTALEAAEKMIRESDNSTTNMFIDYMGGMTVMNQRFKQLGLGGTGVRNWLPDLDGTNTITTKSMATILYNLARPGVLSDAARSTALRIMEKIHNNRLIPAGLPKEAIVAHKTGDIGSSLGDSAIVTLPDGDQYILSIQVERPHNDGNAKPLIIALSREIYNYRQEMAAREQSTLATADIKVPGELD